MILIKKIVVGSLSTNCYFLIDNKNKDTIIIDPGDDANYLSEYITSNNLKLNKIIATHGHVDHILGVMQLKLIFNADFYMNKKDSFLINYLEKSAKYFLNQIEVIKPIIDYNLNEKTNISLSGKKLKIIETPGHTPGSVSIYINENNSLLVGDLLFYNGGVGRTDFSYSNKANLYESIHKIFKLPKKTKILSGHGEDSTIGKEIKFHEKEEN